MMDDAPVLGRPEGVEDEDGQGQEEADGHRTDRRKRQQWILQAATGEPPEP